MSGQDFKTHQKIGLHLAGNRDNRVKIVGAAIGNPRGFFKVVKVLFLIVCGLVLLDSVPNLLQGLASPNTGATASDHFRAVVAPALFTAGFGIPVVVAFRHRISRAVRFVAVRGYRVVKFILRRFGVIS